MKKSDREIMEILEAFDTTGSAHSAPTLAGMDPKTVRRYVTRRDAGVPVDEPMRRPSIIDEFRPKIAEAVETSEGQIRHRVENRVNAYLPLVRAGRDLGGHPRTVGPPGHR